MLFGPGKKEKSIKSREKAEIRCIWCLASKKKASNPERKPEIDAFSLIQTNASGGMRRTLV